VVADRRSPGQPPVAWSRSQRTRVAYAGVMVASDAVKEVAEQNKEQKFAEIDSALPLASGERYPEAMMQSVNR